jgi:prepilin-type N-terminal cleavage/methylation domain-containing protein
MRTSSWQAQRGFTLIDMLVVVALVGIILAMAVPGITGSLDRMRLGQTAREVERELQGAKSRAVSKGRTIRVRFNCPGPGEYRAVEILGSPKAPVAADNAGNRCDPVAYPFPAADNDPITRPNLDGPVRRLDSAVQFGLMPRVEFRPDGTARYDTGTGGEWPMIPTSGISIRLDRGPKSSTILVNGLGKITLQTQ